MTCSDAGRFTKKTRRRKWEHEGNCDKQKYQEVKSEPSAHTHRYAALCAPSNQSQVLFIPGQTSLTRWPRSDGGRGQTKRRRRCSHATNPYSGCNAVQVYSPNPLKSCFLWLSYRKQVSNLQSVIGGHSQEILQAASRWRKAANVSSRDLIYFSSGDNLTHKS